VIEYYIFVGLSNGDISKIDQNIFSNDITNFLLGIPFVADSCHMESLTRTNTDINWAIMVNLQEIQ
jgi:hypothetical protein